MEVVIVPTGNISCCGGAALQLMKDSRAVIACHLGGEYHSSGAQSGRIMPLFERHPAEPAT